MALRYAAHHPRKRAEEKRLESYFMELVSIIKLITWHILQTKSTGLDTLTQATLTQSDLHIVGDVSDSGRAKAITENELEDYIANGTNFVDELVSNNYFITNLQTAGIGSSMDCSRNGVSVEDPVDTINIIAPSGTVTTPSAGVVNIDLTSLMGGRRVEEELNLRIKQISTNNQTFTTLYTKNFLVELSVQIMQ